jgi:hypothetical protein
MKRVVVPFIEKLNNCEISDAASVLENECRADVVESVNWFNQFPYKPITFFNIAHSRKSLFIRFYVHGNLLKAVYSADQSPVREDSCVAFYCQSEGNDYFSYFEFNCIGTCSAGKRFPNGESEQFDPSEMKTIRRYPSIGTRALKEMQGFFEWEVTVEIPFILTGIDPDHLPEKLAANFYKCTDAAENEHYVSWNPVKTDFPDFNHPEFFGELILTE